MIITSEGKKKLIRKTTRSDMDVKTKNSTFVFELDHIHNEIYLKKH